MAKIMINSNDIQVPCNHELALLVGLNLGIYSWLEFQPKDEGDGWEFFSEAIAGVKYRASARVCGFNPNYDTTRSNFGLNLRNSETELLQKYRNDRHWLHGKLLLAISENRRMSVSMHTKIIYINSRHKKMNKLFTIFHMCFLLFFITSMLF